MRGRSSTWTRIRINLQHVPEKERPQGAEAAADPESVGRRYSGADRGVSRDGTEDRGKLESRSDFELIVAAVLRRLVVAPAKKRRRMPEAIALHVVVLHLAHALDAQRLPRQIFARTPSALSARHALCRDRPPAAEALAKAASAHAPRV